MASSKSGLFVLLVAASVTAVPISEVDFRQQNRLYQALENLLADTETEELSRNLKTSDRSDKETLFPSERLLDSFENDLNAYEDFEENAFNSPHPVRHLLHKRGFFRSRCCYIDVLCSRGCRRSWEHMLTRHKRNALPPKQAAFIEQVRRIWFPSDKFQVPRHIILKQSVDASDNAPESQGLVVLNKLASQKRTVSSKRVSYNTKRKGPIITSVLHSSIGDLPSNARSFNGSLSSAKSLEENGNVKMLTSDSFGHENSETPILFKRLSTFSGSGAVAGDQSEHQFLERKLRNNNLFSKNSSKRKKRALDEEKHNEGLTSFLDTQENIRDELSQILDSLEYIGNGEELFRLP